MINALPDTVYLFDVDNTLLDNDAIVRDLRTYLVDAFGQTSAAQYWLGFEALRDELGYADYLGALQRYRINAVSAGNAGDTGKAGNTGNPANNPKLLAMSSFLIDYPFASRLYPGALDALAHARRRGPVVILSDGDVVFQPRKIERSGVWHAAEGRVLIYIHKEQMLEDLQRRHPARHYVMVDDKLRILSAMKAQMGALLTTVFVRQGHYAFDLPAIKDFPPADLTIERIGDLASVELP